MYIYGKNVVEETIKNKKKVHKAYVYEKFSDNQILQQLKDNNIPTISLPKGELDKITEGNHQGIILEVDDFEYCDLEELFTEEDTKLLILDHIEDPHNFGAIIRTCEAAGIDGIIIPKDRSVEVNSTVMRVSVGALEYVKIAMVTNIARTMNYLKSRGFWIIGTDMEGEDYTKIDYRGRIAIVIGNEGNGMSKVVSRNCDFIAKIPMKGHINSLNASVAAALVIYEAVKAR